MKQAITRTVGTKSTSKINKMIIKGNAIMSAGTSENDSASILPEMEKLDLSDFAGNLGKYAFHGCAKLESVIFPMENISLPTYAFSECTKLETLYKSGNEHKKGECDLTSVTSVGNYAFMNTAISRVKLPKTFRIPQYCFIACKNLSEIYKEGNSPIDRELDLSGVSNIGYGAFWNYYSVTMKYDTVKLSEQAAIEGNCFRNCWNLVTIYKNGKERRDNEADLSGITDLGEGYFLE